MLAGQKGREKTVIDGIPSYVYFAPIEKTGWSVGIVVPRSAVLRPGILLYTDGLSEAENGQHDQFGDRRIVEVLGTAGTVDPESMVYALDEAVHAFVGPAEQSDDLTMLAIRFLGKPS